MNSITVLLTEDHQIVREGTRQLLEQVHDIHVVGEAATGEEAIRLAGELRPDVVVMDVRLPGMGGIEATRLIKERYPHVAVLILSAYEDNSYVFPLLEAGASGYLLKTSSGAELAQAIRDVHDGATALDPHIAAKLVHRLTHRERYRADGMAESLTEREVQVLRAAAGGVSNKGIAEKLVISPYTVQVHLRNIYSKLGVSSRTEAVTYAVREGWIDLDGIDG